LQVSQPLFQQINKQLDLGSGGGPFKLEMLRKSALPAIKTVARACRRGAKIAGVNNRTTRCTSLASRASERWLGALLASIKNNGRWVLIRRKLRRVVSPNKSPISRKVGIFGWLAVSWSICWCAMPSSSARFSISRLGMPDKEVGKANR
jgi:hypothetical protein